MDSETCSFCTFPMLRQTKSATDYDSRAVGRISGAQSAARSADAAG